MKRANGQSKSIFDTAGTSGGVNSFDWGAIDTDRLARLVGLITGRGGAVRFGYTRDGNAGSIGLYYGDDRNTVYIRPDGDCEEVLGLIERTFEALPYSKGKSPQ